MADYISREDAIAVMHKLHDDDVALYSVDIPECFDAKTAVEALRTIHTADVVEVRHGENIGEDYDAVDQFVCSKCGIELQGWYRVERDMDDGEETHHEYVMRYCPNCGAKMDEVEE